MKYRLLAQRTDTDRPALRRWFGRIAKCLICPKHRDRRDMDKARAALFVALLAQRSCRDEPVSRSTANACAHGQTSTVERGRSFAKAMHGDGMVPRPNHPMPYGNLAGAR